MSGRRPAGCHSRLAVILLAVKDHVVTCEMKATIDQATKCHLDLVLTNNKSEFYS